jgi:TP901 family phage tail tape measure protein
MAKKISSSDLFAKEDIFEGIRLSAEKTIEQLNILDTEFKQLATAMQSNLKGATTNTTQGINQFVQTTQKANTLMEQSISITKMKAQAEQQLQKANQEAERTAQQKEKTAQASLRTQQQQAKEAERQARAQEKVTRTAQAEANAYKRLEKNTRDLKNQSKQLGAEMLNLERAGKKNSAEYQRLADKYKSVTASAQRGDAQLKKIDKTVGDNFRNVGNYTSAMGKLNNVLGAFGVAFGVQAVAQVFRTGAGAVIEFDQAISDLQAITGASGKDLEYYREQANLLGKDVEGGASAVVEAYKLIGSAKPELLKNAEALNAVTKSAITLAQAAGISVPDSAKNLTDAMNQFGASAEDADKFINVLASGSKFGAVEIPQVTEALLKFGAVAKSSGVSIEETGALIEALGERGLKGAEAGTALRNVMLKLSAPDALPKKARKELTALGINFDTLKDKSLSFTDRLRALTPILSNQTALVKTFGTENAVAGMNLIQLTDRTDELRNQMTGTNTAYEQAETRTATLGHAVMQLKNAFLGMFTSINTGGGAMKSVVSSIQFLAKNLGTIIQVIGKVLRIYVTFKAVTMAQTLANNALGGSFVKVAQRVGIMKASLMGLSRGFKALKTAIASNPLGILVTVATEIYANWDKVQEIFTGVKTQTEEMKEAMKNYNEEVEGSAKNTAEMNKYVSEETSAFFSLITQIKNTTYESAERQKLINEINSKYGTTLQNIKDETKFTAQLNTAVANYIALKEQEFKIKKNEEAITRVIEKKVNATQRLGKAQQKLRAEEERLAGIQEMQRGTFDPVLVEQYAKDIENAKGNIVQYGEEVALAGFGVSALNDRLNQLGGGILDTKARISQLTAGYVDMDEEMENVGGTTDKNKDKQKEINTEFKKTNDYLSKQEQLLNNIQDIERKRKIQDIEEQIRKEVEIQQKKVSETGEFDLTSFSNLVEEKYRLEVNRILDQATFEQEENEKKYAREKQARIDALEAEYKDLKKGAEGNAEALKKIDNNYAIAKQKLADDEKLIYQDLLNENILTSKEATDEAEALEKSKLDFTKSTNDELLKSANDYASKKGESDKELTDLELEALKKAEEQKRAIVTQTTEVIMQQSQKRVDQMDAEIAKAQEQYENYKQLAQDGNITAQQSLAEQQRIIDEANMKKERELKRQQRIKLAESVYSTYSAKVESGSKNPLADTIRDTTLLAQFIQSIPTFMDGTEDTGLNGKGIDGKGGFHAILHPNERVVPKSLNQKIGALSNEQLAKVAHEYQNGKAMEGANQTASALDLSLLINEIKDLKGIIRDKPETSVALGEITHSVVEIVEKRVRGNNTVFNKFNVRR